MVQPLWILFGLLVAGLVVVAGWRTLTGNEDRHHAVLVDFLRLERLRKGNNYLLAPNGLTPRTRPNAPSPDFAASPAAVARAAEAVVLSEPRTRILARSPDGLRFKAVQRSRIMNYPDYVDIAVLPSGGGSTIAIYSRAHYGTWDLGVNRARVKRWLAALSVEVDRRP